MRKILLLLLALGIGTISYTQQAYQIKSGTRSEKAIIKSEFGVEPLQVPAITKSKVEQQVPVPAGDRNTDIVTVIDIGTCANPWSYAISQMSSLWVDQTLNTVTNFHRMGGALDPGGYSGDFGFDISTDGGMTWENQIECYVAVDNGGGTYYLDAARYPNHALYNPTGDLNDAYIAWFAPVLDGSNASDSWGGYLFGTVKVSDTSQRTRTIWSTGDGIYREVPEGYDLSAAGVSFGLGLNEDWSTGSIIYQQEMLLNRGEWDEEAQDFIYTEMQIPAECTDDVVVPANHKIAFGPDGMTGYIVLLSDNGEAEQQSGFLNYYPIIYKTTDGGLTWSDPQFIQLDGADGIAGIVYQHLTDQQITDLFEPPVPAREDISYTTAFDCDPVVDKNNNLHIAVVIGPTGSDAHSIITAEGYIKAYDLFSMDDGATWQVEVMGSLRTFRGTWGTLSEDNRIQISTNSNRDKFFIAWLDTDLEEETDNNRPNIWCRGFDPFASTGYMKTANAAGEDAPTNVTNFSAGMWQAYLGTTSKMILEPEEGTYLIPMTYIDLDPTDDLQPVQVKYITDFSYTDADFIITGLGESHANQVENISVSQNYPNPFSDVSYVTVNLSNGSDLSMEIISLTGKLVWSKDYGYTAGGTKTLSIHGNDLVSGVYFYTIAAGKQKVTRKLVVE